MQHLALYGFILLLFFPFGKKVTLSYNTNICLSQHSLTVSFSALALSDGVSQASTQGRP